MSFPTLVKGWASDASTQGADTFDLFNNAFPLNKKQQLLEHTVVKPGRIMDFDIYSQAGKERLGRDGDDYVWWLKLKNGEEKAYFKDQKGGLKELSIQVCQAIWKNVHTKELDADPLGIGSNRRRLPCGATIPIIPKKFKEYKENNQRKSKDSRERKKRGHKLDRDPCKAENLYYLARVDLACLPTLDAMRVSVVCVAPGFFRKMRDEKRSHEECHVEDTFEAENLMTWARRSQQAHAPVGKEFPFANCKTYEDFFRHEDHAKFMNWFDYFFPE